jgi:hypothetical protein
MGEKTKKPDGMRAGLAVNANLNCHFGNPSIRGRTDR